MTDTTPYANGIQLPATRPLSRNELAWIEFLRLLSNDTDPSVTLAGVQALRQGIRSGEFIQVKQVFSLMTLELWFRQFMDGHGVRP